MAAGMDGCVSKPAEPGPLLNTLRAAVPLHLSQSSPIDGRPLEVEASQGRARGGVKVVQGKGMGVLKGSAACAAEGMALATRHEESVEGALQVCMMFAHRYSKHGVLEVSIYQNVFGCASIGSIDSPSEN